MIDNNLDYTDRIIVSDLCIAHLAKSEIWMMDGTFKVTPSLFQQLYVIRAHLEDTAISCVYALMKRKSQDSYKKLLDIICQKCKFVTEYEP